MGRNYKQYHTKIDVILRRLDGGQPSDAELEQIESDLNGLAGSYQTDEALGASRYKLYAAQASIEYYRGNDQRAKAFMDEAVRVKGVSFDFAEEFLGRLQPPKNQWLARISKLTAWQAAVIIAVIGFAVAFSGLSNPFMYDDMTQIVSNVPVHSIKNIPSFFGESTFYVSRGDTRLTGAYYRPLMTTSYSLLYSLFGLHSIAFHLFQLLLYIASAFLLYLVLSYSFSTILSLLLSLIFLVHPLNSQIIFAIPTLQDTLFFFFGILGVWLLLRFHSTRSLVLVVLCLFLSLLSKESGVLFFAIVPLYLFWFDRRRLLPFLGMGIFPVILWLILKTHAVGLFHHTHLAPIDQLSLVGRLFTIPSILLFYISKFVFPLHLASGYYWTYPHISFAHVLLPLLIDSAVVGLIIYLAVVVQKRVSETMFYTYVFFGIWAALGISLYLQIIPLDFTACETWFYFSMAGVLGMIGVVLTAFEDYINPIWFLVIAVSLIGLLGFRTAARGIDWSSQDKLAYADVSVAKDNFSALRTLAQDLDKQGKYTEAKAYAHQAITAYPSSSNFLALALVLEDAGDINGAAQAYSAGLHARDDNGAHNLIYFDFAQIILVYGDDRDKPFFQSATNAFPRDPYMWMYLAMFDAKYHDSTGAHAAISKATNYGSVPQWLYGHIMNNEPFTFKFPNLRDSLTVQ